jgi:hypothetical protein
MSRKAGLYGGNGFRRCSACEKDSAMPAVPLDAAVVFRRVGGNNETCHYVCGDAMKLGVWQPNVLRCSPIMIGSV